MKARSLATFLIGVIACAGAGCQSGVQNQVLILSEQNKTLKAELADARRRLGEVEERLAKSADPASVSRMQARIAQLEGQVKPSQARSIHVDGVNWEFLDFQDRSETASKPVRAGPIDLFRFPPEYDFGVDAASDSGKESPAVPNFSSTPIQFKEPLLTAPREWLIFYDWRHPRGDLIDEHPRRRE
jgi:hypothetical protein